MLQAAFIAGSHYELLALGQCDGFVDSVSIATLTEFRSTANMTKHHNALHFTYRQLFRALITLRAGGKG
jgi:hypothetical protein